MIRRIISFRYTTYKRPEDFSRFFETLFAEHSLVSGNDDEIVEQLICESDLKQVVLELRSTLNPSDEFSFDKLDRNCVKSLTRMVKYRKRVFESPDLSTYIEIKMSDANDFPVVGFEIWKNGCDSLPGGMVTINSESQVYCDSIAESIREYSQNTMDSTG